MSKCKIVIKITFFRKKYYFRATFINKLIIHLHIIATQNQQTIGQMNKTSKFSSL